MRDAVFEGHCVRYTLGISSFTSLYKGWTYPFHTVFTFSPSIGFSKIAVPTQDALPNGWYHWHQVGITLLTRYILCRLDNRGAPTEDSRPRGYSLQNEFFHSLSTNNSFWSQYLVGLGSSVWAPVIQSAQYVPC